MADHTDQPFYIIAVSRNMMAAAEVHPFHLIQVPPELLFKCFRSFFQIVGILFAKSVKMQTVQERQEPLVKIFFRRPQAGARGTGIVDSMAFLGRALRIDPKTHLLSGFFRLFSIFP